MTISLNISRINGHDYVDLGLSSGLKWATCNVGAEKPEDYGDYYAWGETVTKVSYTEKNSRMYGKKIIDYSSKEHYDVARKKWGGTWRMPTVEECMELIVQCTWEWTKHNGVNGYNVMGPNGNSIFLPAAGYRCGSSLHDTGEYGYYWSSTSYDDSNNDCACDIDFNWDYYYVDDEDRCNGQSVRPVTE